MTALRAAGTLLAADPGTRQLTYRLLPYGEAGRTNLGVITAAAGTVELPAAADVVLNLEHERRRPVGRGRALVESAAGLDATFGVAETTAGNDLLAEAAAGLRTGASVELEDVVIRDGRLISARLVGAGAVVDPAFPSAQLVASDTGGDQGDDTDDDADSSDDGADNPQVTPAVIPVAIPDPDTDDDTDSTDDTDSEADMTTTTSTAAAGTLAATRAPAGLPTARTARTTEPGFREIVRLLATAGRSGGQLFATLQQASPGSTNLFAALADITPGTTSVNDITQLPQWLGELWSGRSYMQRYVPLLDHKDLTAMQMKGWRWTTKPEVGPYAGEKAAVPSNPATTEPYVLDAFRLAGAHDIDRIFRDFNVEEFWTGYWQAMTESYARQADGAAATLLVDQAPYVAPGTVPAGVSKGATYIVDGAIAIIDTALPTFAIVSKDLYRDLLLTRAEDVLAYLNLALGLEAGTINSFSLVPGDATFPADTVIVGNRAAATVYELPGSPIRVEALNIANGGIDCGLFGYMAAGVNDDGGLALVSGTAPLPLDDDDTATSSRSGRRGRRTAKA